MADVALLFGKLLFLALLYLFLFAAVRAGLGLVAGGSDAQGARMRVVVSRGPRELVGTRLNLTAPLTVGRSPEADIVIGDGFVSTMHARISPARGGALVEDLGSTNGTTLNGEPLDRPAAASPGDIIGIGQVELTVERA